MRALTFVLVATVLCSAAPEPAEAQGPMRQALEQAPSAVARSQSIAKPALSRGGLLVQTGAGILGGMAALVPILYVTAGSGMDEGLMLGAVGVAYTAGTTAGIHYAGRAQRMTARPWATAAGVLAGLALSGAAMQPFIDEDGNADGPAPLLVFVIPSMAGTAGYALTRRSR